ncbi:hypothetical protein H0H92_002146 [Tricholoma furcatifolium]|nr:hypothetical protein H0H92_002146 [Tricholoma furcatifolium]
MDAFKIPPTIPQDLLLIHDIIGVPSTVPSSNIVKKAVEAADDSIDSSGSELESEDEIEADLMALADEEVPDSSAASDSSSDSDSESESEQSSPREKALEVADLDDEEDGGPALTSGSYFQTKNEVAEADIIVPTIAEVGAEELLEKVGEIMSVMGNTVIIKGIPSEVADRGSDRALDSDTLLVFEDRKVMGYVYETFGPTSQPFYQVKFNTAFPLDSEKVQVSHDIFHVPTRSNFVFTSQLKKLKGSDASNVHDEEPADHELEFSDDEAEAAHKASMKRKRGESRSHSVAASSRHTSPVPSQSYDMEQTAHFSRNPYDEHGPYDVDFGAGPSRPPPMPYDDPYADNFLSTSDGGEVGVLDVNGAIVGDVAVVEAGVEMIMALEGILDLKEDEDQATLLIFLGQITIIRSKPYQMTVNVRDHILRLLLLSRAQPANSPAALITRILHNSLRSL